MTFRGSEGEEELWYSFVSLEHLAENGMDTKEIEVIKNHRPISHGLFFRRRSIGPLPSCSNSAADRAAETNDMRGRSRNSCLEI